MGFANSAAGGLLAVAVLLTGQAQAAPLRLVYDGYLSADANALDTLNGAALPHLTPFEVRAGFDGNQPNFLAPGLAWYQPSNFTMTIEGATYQVSRVQDDPLYGQAVVVFDKTSPFSDVEGDHGEPHYGVGFFSAGNPQHIGIIGDWSYAAPEVTIGTLVSTVFTTFYGVGYNKGQINLELSGARYALILNDAYEYNATDPSLEFYGNRVRNPTIPDNYAALVAVPEPASLAILASALLLAGLLAPRLQHRH